MELSEKEIENFIFEDLITNNGLLLKNHGLQMAHDSIDTPLRIKWCQQLSIPPYGVIDIVGFFRYRGFIHVELIELKAVPIECADFDQIFRYKKGLEIYLKNTFKGGAASFEINCYLIGRGFKSGAYIQNNSFITVSDYDYGLDGIWFNTTQPGSNWYVPYDGLQSFRHRKRQLNGSI